ncbi:MAG: DUF3280 domain-containing protein [Pseudomonadota bacterium]
MRLVCLLLLWAGAASAEGRIAFLGLTMLDTSLQTTELGQSPEEAARLNMVTALVEERFAAAGCTFLDLAPARADLDRVVNPAKCYGCDIRIGAALGADYVLVGEVQKVSNLILTMNLQLRDVASGETVKGRVVDIRANTDESWLRGMRYILKTAFFAESTQ